MDELGAVLKAREFVSKISPLAVPVEIQSYLAQVNAVLHPQTDMRDDESGCSFSSGGKHYICVNANDRSDRQRFTVCHEIAHIVLGLPSNHKALPSWSYARRPLVEVLCDVFAAELLLPYRLFRDEAERMPLGIASVEELGARFRASTTATGSRFAAVVSAPCAFVLAEQGKVRYASRSTALREANAWIQLRIDIPRGSLSERVRAGGSSDGTDKIDADIWFSDWERGGVLLEEARHFPGWDQTLTMLWFEDEEVPPPKLQRELREDEQELGLEELDGNLRWPSKKRHR